MPGNEVGDRIHNFFGQENLSQGQHHPQAVDGTWPGLNNNPWVGSQRQIGAPLISNLKNYSIQQSADSDRGHGGQSLNLQHGLNFTQPPLKPDLTRSHSQNQQPTLNGYMHGHQALQTRQNESNFLGVDAEYNQHNLTSRGLPILDSQLANGPELNKKNSLRLESTESPVNYDFFGGQQQMSSKHPGMLQSLPTQQSGINDMQLLQQQFMLKKLQEFQRQQQLPNPQFQQQESRQPSSIDQISSVMKQAAASHTSGHINGIPMQDTSNYSWQPELVGTNTNWLQRGASQVIQGSSSGLMFLPDQGQVRAMGLVPQQVDQSLYGVPITGARTNPNQYSSIQMDKPTIQQISAISNSFPGNQYATFLEQVNMQDGTMVSRQGHQSKNMFGPDAGQGLNSGLNFENMQHMNAQQRSAPMQEFHERQELVGPSETSPEKTVMQAATSQSAATLDPEEEKILFGSDDNLWEAFGRGSNGSGCSNMMDGSDFLGAFPSLQSGSWSALMQSAVAETSSGDIGQEGWNGLGVRSSEPPTATQHTSYVNNGSKQPSAWPDNSLHAVSNLNSRPFPLSVDANTSVNYSSVSGVQQSGLKTSQEPSEKLQNDSSNTFLQKFSGEGNKWLDRGPSQKSVAEGGQFYGNVAHSSEAEINVKCIAASWTHQESMSSYNSSGQPCNRPNGWNFIESVSPSGDATSRNQFNENSLQLSQSGDHKGAMHEKMGHVTDIRKPDSASSAIEHAKSAIGHPLFNREDTDLNNAAAISDTSTVRANQKSSQHLYDSQNLNFWKNVDSSVNLRGGNVLGKSQDHDKIPHNIESPGNRGLDNGGIEHETEKSNVKEKSSDSFHSNMSHHTSTAGLKENIWLDASDTHNFPGGKQKSSGHVSRKPSGTRKFQYHPMGDVDIDAEPSYGIKNVTLSHSVAQPVSRGLSGHEQAFLGQSKDFGGHIGKNSLESEKGRLPGLQGDAKYIDEVPSKSVHPGYVPVTSSPFEKSIGNYAPNKTVPSSQNMLELLHKVDQPKEHCPATHFSSSERNQSEIPEAETPNGSIGHLQQNQSSSSQGFGLQLAPPSQRLPIPDHALSFQGSFQTVNSLTTSTTSEMGKKDQTWLASTPPVQPLHSSCAISQGDSRNNISGSSGQTGNKNPQSNVHGNFSTGFPHFRSHLQNQQMSSAGGQAVTTQSANLSVDRFFSESSRQDDSCERTQSDLSKVTPHAELGSSAETSQVSNNNQNHAKVSAQQFPILEAMPVSQPSVPPGMSQHGAFSKMLPNAWSTAPNQQTSSAAHGPPNLFKPHLQSTNDLERTSSGKQRLDDQISQKGDSGPFGFAVYSSRPQGFVGNEQSSKEQQISPENEAGQKTMGVLCLQGKESIVDHLSETLSNSSATQRDIEAFGRSLKPNTMLHQKYSLLHQMQSIKSTEIDSDNRSVKRLKGPDSGMDAQQVASVGGQQLSYGSNNIIRDGSSNRASLPPGDSKMLSFSSQSGYNRGTNASPNDMLALDHADSQSLTSNNSVVRGEHSQISPQMALSWFDQYRTFKNGQMLPTFDARTDVMKTTEQPITVGKPSESFHVGHSMQANALPDASQLVNVLQSSSPMSQASGQLLSPQSMPSVITDQSLVLVRPNKRKSATSGLLSWHREVMHGFQRLQNISMAEMEWAQESSRLMEKVEDETELIEDGPPVIRSRRRLILTTQLMQQLFHPPPAKLLSSDATSHYESVTYFIARSALGDACSNVSSSRSDSSHRSDTFVHPDSGNPLPEKLKPSERIGHQYIKKAVEDFIKRAQKLEDDFLRLDKRASILDLRVECQDLEKFSVINRFAKFHGRGQAEGAETSSSSDAHTQKFFPQRYVTALPMPRNLPDRVQCLSL